MRLSYSLLIDWRKCHRLGILREQYEPLEIPPPLWFGDIAHQALEKYYMKGEHPTNTFQLLARKRAGELNPVKYEELYDMGRAMFDHYVLWAQDNDKFTQVKAAETWFELPLPKSKHIVVGKVDQTLSVKNKKTWEKWLGEFKTADSIEKDWLLLNEQATIYLWADAQQNPADRAKGVVFTMLRKKAPVVPEIREGKLWLAKNADSSSHTIKSLLGKKVKDPDNLVGKYQEIENGRGNAFVQRMMITRNDNQLAEIEERMRQIADEIERSEPFPTPSIANCRGCKFHEVCVGMERGEDYQWLLDNLFRKKGEK